MTENEIDFGANADDRSSEESLQEGSEEEEEDRQTEYLEEPSSNEVDLGGGVPKRKNWFDRCGDCKGVPEDQVLSIKAKNNFSCIISCSNTRCAAQMERPMITPVNSNTSHADDTGLSPR